jgi:hypothetical protein
LQEGRSHGKARRLARLRGRHGQQYFIIRKDGQKLFGLACGRCDNPYTHGALQHLHIAGDTLEFDIVHQGWGDGAILPLNRHVVAYIAMNEMRMDAPRPDQTRSGHRRFAARPDRDRGDNGECGEGVDLGYVRFSGRWTS